MTNDELSFQSLLKAENLKLKKKIDELEDSLLKVTQSIQLLFSGTTKSKNNFFDIIDNMIESSNENLYIASPKIDDYFTSKLINKAKSGLNIQIIINERRLLVSDDDDLYKKDKKVKKDDNNITEKKIDYTKNYDILKVTPRIDLINYPNVLFLLLINSSQAFISGGWLEESILKKKVLIGTLIKDLNKVSELLNIYNELKPSFMRKI